MKISIRKCKSKDLEILYLNQTDYEANQMAAFTNKDPLDKNAFMAKWEKLLLDPKINIQTIMVDQSLVGCVVKYIMDGEAEITYQINRNLWGKGITSEAVKQFLLLENTRPIYGRVAFDNFGSKRILEKMGFNKIGKSTGFSNARGKEIEEYIYKLET